MRQTCGGHSRSGRPVGPAGVRPGWRTGLGVAALLLVGVAPVRAQSGSVGGTVLSAKTLQPLGGAQVVVTGSQAGTITDGNGRFLIPGQSGTVELQVILIGYKTQTTTAQAGKLDVRVLLEESAVSLSQLVVTGQPGAVQQRAVGNSVAQIKAADVVATAPVNSMQDLINGRAPGVVVMPGTGMVGSGSRIRIRGQSTFSLSGDPLIYVDGVRVDNETGSGISVQAFGSGVVSRLNDFNPEQIESIEILKGPAAATLYGTEAARGVINIITKKGTPGGTRYTFTVKQGANWFSNPQGRMPVNYWRNPATGNVESLNIIDYYNQRGENIFRTGRMQTYNGSVSGGNSTLRYYVSGNVDKNEGAEPTNYRNQFSGRANVEVSPSEKFKVTASTGYIRSNTSLNCEAGCGGAMWGSVFSTPANLAQNRCADSNEYGCDFWGGFRSGPPAVDRSLDQSQGIDRFTGSVQLNYKPFEWFTNRLTIGTDVTQEDNVEFLPYLTNDTLQYFWGPTLSQGYRYEDRRALTFDTYDYSGTVSLDVTPTINASTSLGLQYYTKHIEFMGVEGDQFAGPGLETVNAAAVKPYTSQDYTDNNTLGFYGQETFAFSDRLFLTAALRVDNNSAFGSDLKWVTYPKASLSWVLSDEPSVQQHLPSWLTTFKARAAYGESGQQPVAFSALRTFTPVTGPGGTPAVTPNAIGNPALGPERGQELELGFDSGFLDDRLGLTFTYYHTLTKDGILLRPVAPSYGFATSQYVNAGEILNQGIEAQVNAQLLNRGDFAWDMTFNLATNKGEVKKLAGEDTTIVVGSNQFRIGYAPNAWFRERVVSANYDAATDQVTDIMCDDGNGGVTPCYSDSGQIIAPRVYLGRTTPSLEGSVSSTFVLFNRLRIGGLVDFKSGYKKLDNNLRARCQIFNLCYENIYPEKSDPKLLAQMRSNGTLRDFVINDASFVKLREISLGYTLPDSYIQRFGARSASIDVAARNLHTWTSYTGLDPENTFLSGSPGFLEQDNLPQLMQFVTTLHVSF